jgi:hypothetical protein
VTVLGFVGFTSPGLLFALIGLPVLWILLRAVPPAPVRRLFPGVALMRGLSDTTQETDKTPWWLLLLRMLAIVALIVAMSGPVLNPEKATKANTSKPLLILMDASWASAPDWSRRIEAVERKLMDAGRQARPVAILLMSDPQPVSFVPADRLIQGLVGLTPASWGPQLDGIQDMIPTVEFDTVWFSDGLEWAGRMETLDYLKSRGAVQIIQPRQQALGLLPVQSDDGALVITGVRSSPGSLQEIDAVIHGTDPAGNAVVFKTIPLVFDADALKSEGRVVMPSELRGRITRVDIRNLRSAGAVTLTGDTLRLREVALVGGNGNREGLELLTPLHYLEKALGPQAQLLFSPLTESLLANPDAVILADVAVLTPAEREGLERWVEAGGTLLRFAGPRLAASNVSRDVEDSLMPVRLRVGGRTVGGAMSWGSPKSMADFPKDSPFAGLQIPQDVRVSSQVMAQPDPNLAKRVIAQLSDGTPLVTRKMLGEGQVVLFHITANAEWSTLPLSGLFAQMLERLAVSGQSSQPKQQALAGTTWQVRQSLDGFGRLQDAGQLAGVPGEALLGDPSGPMLPPGIYDTDQLSFVRNVLDHDSMISPAVWPVGTNVQTLAVRSEQPLSGYFLAVTLVFLACDIVATLALGGRLVTATFAVLIMVQPSGVLRAQDYATIASEVRLGYILTGDPRIDTIARQGLSGLSETLFFRTSIEPGEPVGVDLEQDELAFFPILYWPISPEQPIPSDTAYAALNTYLRSGGLILFDSRDADVARFGGGSANGRKLRELAAPLDIPALEPVPTDHVLTRTFYLLQEFPGRYRSRDVWVESAPVDAELSEDMPFRNLNDNVTPVVIGGNDWASAWALDVSGMPIYPIGQGFSGERQREIALRFGVNLVMHVLTGNYKSDQVHVPALLDRLGQ